ncbi:MAG: CotH kinase family protein [Lachnospiraceae bacterium]|nr:CotH kinase family protein [Lachnospiraceae bacterium]
MIIDNRKLKKIRWLFVFLTALLPLLFLPKLFTDMKIYNLLRENKIDTSVTFTYTGDRQVKCYNANPGNPESMSYVFLPSYADMAQIGVETIAERVDFIGGPETISVKSGEYAACSFETGLPYRMHFYNASGTEIGTRDVTFLKSGGLPVMYVNTRTGSMERLDADKTYKEKASIEFLDSEGELVFTDDIRSISARGNQTFTFEKKSYQLNLSVPVDFMNMGMSDTWILLCNVYDPAYIRNKLTYEMALQADMPGSAKSEYIDVYFNDVYAGMYQLCEKVEIGENRLEIADLEAQNRALNGEVLDYADTFVTGNGKGVELARNPQDITGGYLIEHDYGMKFSEVLSGFTTSTGEEFALKNPNHASEAEVTYISNRMQEIEDAIRAEDGYNPVTGIYYTEYIDLESWADKYLIEEITRNNGGGSTSSYFYKPQDSLSTKVYGGPVWDYDKGYGNASGYNKNTRDLAFLTLHEYYTSWFYYLYQHEDFVEMVKKEYQEKFSDYLTIMAEEKADEYLAQIEASAILDQARFGHVYCALDENLEIPFSPDNYKMHAQAIKQFILERKAFLDEVWLEDAPICMVHFKNAEGSGNRCVGVITGECIENLPVESKSNMQFLGWQIEDSEDFLTTQTPVTEEITVYPVWEAAPPQE